MPAVTNIIDSLAAPPLPSLQQVLDTNGPYSGGDHVIDNFTTNGAFLLPAGTYAVGGTYGVIVQATTVPPAAGRTIGFNGIVGGQDLSFDIWHDSIAQVVMLKSFPITGAILALQVEYVHFGTQLFLWTGWTSAPNHMALHVFPNWAVDLYFMCVL